MTDLETLIVFTFGVLPAIAFWILFLSYVTNKVFSAMEKDKQYVDGAKEGQIVVDEFHTYFEYPKEWKEKRDEYLKRNSDYEVAKCKYVYDRLDEYLNTDEATNAFKGIFGTPFETYEWKRDTWKCHLDVKRDEFGTDFDNL